MGAVVKLVGDVFRGVGSALGSGGGGEGGHKPPKPQVKRRELVDTAAIEAARARELALARKRKGRASTILTSIEGILNQADITRKTLLGE